MQAKARARFIDSFYLVFWYAQALAGGRRQDPVDLTQICHRLVAWELISVCRQEW